MVVNSRTSVLCESVPKVVGPGRVGQLLLYLIQRLKQLLDRLVIGFLGRGKSTFIDTVVHIVVDPGVVFVDLGLQILGEQLHSGILLRQQFVERGVEHADDLGRFVVDDFIRLFVV